MKKKIRAFLLSAAAVSLLFSVSALISCNKKTEGGSECDHDYVWTKISDPDCVNDGAEHGVCSLCGDEKDRPIEALGHDWQTLFEPKKATCTEAGTAQQKCSRCSVQALNAVPALGHDFTGFKTLKKEATCEAGGEVEVQCARPGCVERTTVESEPLGHKWVRQSVSQGPTCVLPGFAIEKCSRTNCNAEQDVTLPALGHKRGELVYDPKPSYDAEGKRYYRCARKGCEEHLDEETIPRYEEGKTIPYEFRLVRNNGDLFPDIEIGCKAIGVTSGEEHPFTLRGGSVKVDLVPNEDYRVEFTDVPEGVTLSEETVTQDSPLCTITATGKVISAPMSQNMRYTVGSVMHDFTVETIGGSSLTLSSLLQKNDFTVETIGGSSLTLSSLLQKNKIVVLNFFFAGCDPCQREFGGLQLAYEAYQSDVALVAIDTDPTDTESVINTQVVQKHNITFSVVKYCDPGNAIFNAFNTRSNPTTVVIDREGFVVFIHAQTYGEKAEEEFKKLFDRYVSAAQPAALAAQPALTDSEKRRGIVS